MGDEILRHPRSEVWTDVLPQHCSDYSSRSGHDGFVHLVGINGRRGKLRRRAPLAKLLPTQTLKTTQEASAHWLSRRISGVPRYFLTGEPRLMSRPSPSAADRTMLNYATSSDQTYSRAASGQDCARKKASYLLRSGLVFRYTQSRPQLTQGITA